MMDVRRRSSASVRCIRTSNLPSTLFWPAQPPACHIPIYPPRIQYPVRSPPLGPNPAESSQHTLALLRSHTRYPAALPSRPYNSRRPTRLGLPPSPLVLPSSCARCPLRSKLPPRECVRACVPYRMRRTRTSVYPSTERALFQRPRSQTSLASVCLSACLSVCLFVCWLVRGITSATTTDSRVPVRLRLISFGSTTRTSTHRQSPSWS